MCSFVLFRVFLICLHVYIWVRRHSQKNLFTSQLLSVPSYYLDNVTSVIHQ